jgi:cyclopropane-fatty-acyl-phospholipid synthase
MILRRPRIRYGCWVPDLSVALLAEPSSRELGRRCSGALPMGLVSHDNLCLRARHDCHQVLDLSFHAPLKPIRDVDMDASTPKTTGSVPSTQLSLRRPDDRPPTAPVRARLTAAFFRYIAERAGVPLVTPGQTPPADPAALILHRPTDFYRRIGRDGMVGFGEAYQMSDWDSADAADTMARLLAGIDAVVPVPLRPLRRYLSSRRPAGEENTVPGARENIHYHYDLSNEFFTLFLDPSMTYSSAVFDVDNADVPVADRAALHAAQLRKVNLLLDRAGVADGTRLLEIGTGWGELAIQAARRGAIVHTLTISTEQHDLAVRRIAAEGFSDRVRVDICDYRDVDPSRSGRYDAVVSVEMIEAVGEEYWPDFFTTIDRVLAPDGRVGLQAITMRHDRFLATRFSQNWINKYIFPGGLVPSVPAIDDVLRTHTRLRIHGNYAYRLHYAATLQLWRERLLLNVDEIRRLGVDDVFLRTWVFYLACCEAGFRAGLLDMNQFLLRR